ncbi:MAG TPA: alpha/beta fold hydrolase [Caulobacteraceae bacterium]|jgi:putative redox protein|nr:alpha/beta fold hydrolase [Caulobacteraceae bacterium]
MQSEPFDFLSAQGHTLSARLDRPDGVARAFALFAHCFTCDKTSKAAVRISQALADMGIGVLRFDFTGLGDSEGEFAATGFSSNVEDLIAAARHMAGHGHAPSLLIGHSLGGAAMLAAAADIGSAKAVATIGAPSDPAHVLRLLGDGLAAIEADGAAEVRIGGRPFTLGKGFVDDVRVQSLAERIPHLGRALLVLHSPVDQIVGIDNASGIFLPARHPKSFVSLDTADHLLTDPADADYAAAVICAWASRYVGAAADIAAEAADGAVLVEETGAGKFQVQVTAHGTRFLADEPVDVGGLGSGPSPYELLAAGLGACTCMTVRLYADGKGWPLDRVRASVRHDKVDGQTPPDSFHRLVGLDGPLDDEQRARLMEIAGRCPVHRTLEGGSRIDTAEFAAPAAAPPNPAAIKDAATEHFRDMDAECRKDA